jgi:hypothetical protein
MKRFILLFCIFLVGCTHLKNEEVVRQCRVCDESGLFSEIHYSASGYYVSSVTCGNTRYINDKVYQFVKTKIKDTMMTKDVK